MSSHVFVLDSAFKRTQVKVTPGTHMRDVLEAACKSRNWSPESYALKTATNKTVDLSQPFRLSGLTGGAKLTLIQASRSPSVVNVALQLPESEGGGRISDKFPSTTSLWLVLRKFEDAVAGQPPRKLNLTQRAVPSSQTSGSGRLEYEQPCLHLMGRNMESFAELQKTLSQLGITQSVLIRLTFKSLGEPLEEAMRQIEEYFVEYPVESTQEAKGVQADPVEQMDTTGSSDLEPAPSSETTPQPKSTASETTPQPNPTLPETSESTSLPPIRVYNPPTSSTPAAALHEEDPTTFDPSIDHAKAHQAALTRMTANKRLLSDAELEQQSLAKEAALAEVKTVVVRVRYPDQTMIETSITANTTAGELYAQVDETLAVKGEYQLRFSGIRGMEGLPNVPTKRLVKDFGFKGKMLVTLVFTDGEVRRGPFLKAELLSAAKDLKVELGSQRDAGEASHKAAMSGGESKGKGKAPVDFEAKMKKFMGLGKKK